jgi:hypothetical protein
MRDKEELFQQISYLGKSWVNNLGISAVNSRRDKRGSYRQINVFAQLAQLVEYFLDMLIEGIRI